MTGWHSIWLAQHLVRSHCQAPALLVDMRGQEAQEEVRGCRRADSPEQRGPGFENMPQSVRQLIPEGHKVSQDSQRWAPKDRLHVDAGSLRNGGQCPDCIRA